MDQNKCVAYVGVGNPKLPGSQFMDQCILVRSYTRDVEDDVDDEMINKAKVCDGDIS